MSSPATVSALLAATLETDSPLQRTLREQQTLLDSAGVGIVFIRQRQVVHCNQRYAEIFGYADAAELLGRSSESLHPSPEAFRALGRMAYTTLTEGQTFRCERQMRRRNGDVFWTSLTGRLINPHNSDEGSIWTVDDIDAHKQTRALLETMQQEKQALFDHAMVGIVFLSERRLTHCNHHFELMLGYASGELQGASSRIWYENDAAWEAAGAACYTPLAQGQAFAGELTMRRKDGQLITCEVRSKMLSAQGSVWIAMDVTEHKRAEQALARAHEKLEQLVQERTRELHETVRNLHHEIEERKQDQERIHWLAHYDALTSLPNRMLLAARGRQAIAEAQRFGAPAAVLFLDLDHFKHVNDSLGHRVGDALLIQIGKRLRAVVREYDTVARLGGDEFVLLLPGADERGAQRVAGKLLEAFRRPYQIGHHELTTAPSMGIALYPRDGEDFDSLIQSADVAMYRAKRDGRNTFRFFTPELQAQAKRALQLENALRRALERAQLQLHYQPQIDLASGQVRCVEALLRWQHPELGTISPAEFIPVAEDSGLILPIGEWVLRQALAQLQAWRAQGLVHLKVAVNLSAVQFHQPQLPELVGRLVAEAGLPPGALELELTEGVAVSDPRAAMATMQQLCARGVRLSMDDFGTGYSSLSQLKNFQLYKLKIDQSFVRDLEHDDNDRAMVSAIIRMAQALGLQTMAEGVETQAQLDFLAAEGCEGVQGYFFSPPRAPSDIEQFLLQRA
ncbi:EAL domain-containing protein [Acidovorax sp. HDW3]|uniref:sensor domain-containing protein n=1 Tax=Acidovorax sp. HDW3 TaxID=2714923 RepID=UPI00140DCAB4|nr:EAL domain-containing protein [Acidovorax sp. HDW3]QIL43547.1 EAL domain-containing protein [Acidovorax sp. HDW3]